jgi:hypothetical protein
MHVKYNLETGHDRLRAASVGATTVFAGQTVGDYKYLISYGISPGGNLNQPLQEQEASVPNCSVVTFGITSCH